MDRIVDFLENYMVMLEMAGIAVVSLFLIYIVIKYRKTPISPVKDNFPQQPVKFRKQKYKPLYDDEVIMNEIEQERPADTAAYHSEISEIIMDERGVSHGMIDTADIRTEENVQVVCCPKVYKKPIPQSSPIGRDRFREFAGKSILVAEDNPINRKLLKTLLADSGINLIFAEDGRDVLERVEKRGKNLDLVLLDIRMPGMNGFETAMKMRENNSLDDLPIVAITSISSEEKIKKILDSGMNGYIDKPIVLEKLYSVFCTFMKDYIRPKTKKSVHLSVLDAGEGLSYAMDDRNLYISLLKDFRKRYKNSSEILNDLIYNRRYGQLKKIVIDLKGLSGTLGAKVLHELLARINQALTSHNDVLLEKYTKQYGKELSRLIEAIDDYLE